MVSPGEVEAARLRMLEARKALEDYEKLNGPAPSTEHTRLVQAFTKAIDTYLKLSARQQ
jgi:hypothetical protein